MNKITVHMTKETLYDFLLFHAYSKFSGFLTNILGLAVAFMGIYMYAGGKIDVASMVFYLCASVLFLGYTPVLLKMRAKKQVEINPEYCQPVEYTFCNENGITTQWEDEKKSYSWEQIRRAVVTPKTIGIYYEEESALIIPKVDFDDQFTDIFQWYVQFVTFIRSSLMMKYHSNI